jgi:lipopolysaccharide biosynthesis regulator YciM
MGSGPPGLFHALLFTDKLRYVAHFFCELANHIIKRQNADQSTFVIHTR